jgi:hypothetical protein
VKDSIDMEDKGIVKGSIGMEEKGAVENIGADGTVIGMKESIDMEEKEAAEDIGADGTVIGIIIDITDMMDGGVGDAILGHIIGHGADIMGIMDMTDIDVRS